MAPAAPSLPARSILERNRQVNRLAYISVWLRHLARLENAVLEQGEVTESRRLLVERERACSEEHLRECFRFEKNQRNSQGADWFELLLSHTKKVEGR